MELSEIQPALYQRFQKILLNQTLFHAYLFEGEFGSLEFAIWLAQSQFCQQLDKGVPCGECHPCQKIAANDFSDVQLIQPIGQTIKVEQVRTMIAELTQTGFSGKKRVFIVQSVELLSQSAANALLKFIEEPEADVYLFFITNQLDRVLPTIQSRTQIVRFIKNKSLLSGKLKQQDILPTRADLLAELSTSIDYALAINGANWFDSGEKKVKQWVSELKAENKQAFITVSTKLVPIFDDKEKQKLAFKMIAYYLEQAMLQDYQVRFLANLAQAEKMFYFNVSFQNCLEYIVIKSLWR